MAIRRIQSVKSYTGLQADLPAKMNEGDTFIASDTGNKYLAGVDGLPSPMVPAPAFKTYKALLTQTGTNDPVATVLENNTGLAFNWARTSAGQFDSQLALAGNLESKIAFFISRTNDSNARIQRGRVLWDGKANTTGITIDTHDTNFISVDSGLYVTPIEIQIYD